MQSKKYGSWLPILWGLSLILGGVTLSVWILSFQLAPVTVTIQEFAPQDTSTRPPYTYTDNDKFKEQQDFAHLFNSSKARIVFFGDSHTYRMFWNELLQRSDVVNRGVGSDISEGYLQRLPSVLALKPSICFLQGGGNDLFHHVPEDTLIRNYRLIVRKLKQRGIIPVLTATFYAAQNFGWNDSIPYNQKVASLNQGLAQLASEEQIDFLDLSPQMLKGDYLLDSFAQSDGVHLNHRGYLLWKSRIEATLRKYGI